MPKKNKEELSLEQKKERLHTLINEKNREYKEPIIKYAKDEPIPTRTMFGVPQIDELTGGLPSRRFNIIWGDKGTGKTTLAFLAMAQAQKEKKLCVYINQEGNFDPLRAQAFGVNLDELVIAGPFDFAEQAMDTLIAMCRDKAADFIVMDSIQALSPKGEQETKKGKEKSLEEDEMGLLARKLSKFFRISTAGVYKGDVTVLLIGQARKDLGGFIPLDTLSGGHALLHWSTLTIQVRRGPKSESPTERVTLEEKDEEGKLIKIEKILGFQSIIKLEKVKISGTQPELSEIRLPFYFRSGYLQKEEK